MSRVNDYVHQLIDYQDMMYGKEENWVLVCGGRDFNNENYVFQVLDMADNFCPITKLINGDARGADRLSTKWAIENKVKYTVYPANWERYGRSAGPRRNSKMLHEEAIDLVLAFPGGVGTADMVSKALGEGKYIIKVGW